VAWPNSDLEKNMSILESEIFLSVGTDRNKEKFMDG
jgi:hypothetical protein